MGILHLRDALDATIRELSSAESGGPRDILHLRRTQPFARHSDRLCRRMAPAPGGSDGVVGRLSHCGRNRDVRLPAGPCDRSALAVRLHLFLARRARRSSAARAPSSLRVQVITNNRRAWSCLNRHFLEVPHLGDARSSALPSLCAHSSGQWEDFSQCLYEAEFRLWRSPGVAKKLPKRRGARSPN